MIAATEAKHGPQATHSHSTYTRATSVRCANIGGNPAEEELRTGNWIVAEYSGPE